MEAKQANPNKVYIDSGQGFKEAKPYEPRGYKGPTIDTASGRVVLEDLHRAEPQNISETTIASWFRLIKNRIFEAFGSASTIIAGTREKATDLAKKSCDLNNRSPNTEKMRKMILATMLGVGGLLTAKESMSFLTSIGSNKPKGAPWFMKALTAFTGFNAVRSGFTALTSNPNKPGAKDPIGVLKAFGLMLASGAAQSAYTEGSWMNRILNFFGGKDAYKGFVDQIIPSGHGLMENNANAMLATPTFNR